MKPREWTSLETAYGLLTSITMAFPMLPWRAARTAFLWRRSSCRSNRASCWRNMITQS